MGLTCMLFELHDTIDFLAATFILSAGGSRWFAGF